MVRNPFKGKPGPIQPIQAPTPTAAQQAEPRVNSRVERLVESTLFDAEWYAAHVDADLPAGDRRAAVRHYLTVGLGQGLSPHPLVDPAHIRRKFGPRRKAQLGEDGDPLGLLLQKQIFNVPTHPLFDAVGYLERHPEAADHPDGPTGHYCASAGAHRPNDWWPAGQDLSQWVRDQTRAWHDRAAAAPPEWSMGYDADAAAAERERWSSASPSTASVTVVVNPGHDVAALARTLESLTSQTHTQWTAWVLDLGRLPELDAVLEDHLPGRYRLVVAPSQGEAIDEIRRVSDGDYLTWLQSGDWWEPERLQILLAAAVAHGADVIVDDLVDDSTAKRGYATNLATPTVQGGHLVDPARVLVRSAVVPAVDLTLRGGWIFDVLVRLRRGSERWAQVGWVGTHRTVEDPAELLQASAADRPRVDYEFLDTAASVSLAHRLVDWDELAARPRRTGVVSVVVPTFDDWAATMLAVESVVASSGVGGYTVECIIWDNGSSPVVALQLEALAYRWPEVQVFHTPVNLGYALGNDLALAQTSGEYVVFLNNDAVVGSDWLEGLIAPLSDPDVLGVQPVIVNARGSIQTAGWAFPACGGLPHPLLEEFPVEDAQRVAGLQFAAVSGVALVLRATDVIAIGGFDPIFLNGLDDVDLCHRLRRHRPGHFRVVPDVTVIHQQSRTPGRFVHHLLNRAIYLDRWAKVDEPKDDARLWAACGFTVLDHEVRRSGGRSDRFLDVPEPLLVRSSRLQVDERPASLRWAIKIASPSGGAGESWGDTHFARDLAAALRQLGQEVVIDHRYEFQRDTGRHDDVALVLRGLFPLRATPEFPTLAWVISHPDMVTRAEAASYDHVFAASRTWAQERTAAWGVPVEPLLQATDPARFHPERALPDSGHQVLFVGNSRKIHRPVVRDAMAAGLPLTVYGGQWEEFVPREVIAAEYLANEELAAAYRGAGFVLNDHWDDMAREGFLSNRLFDAAAAGARVITDDVAGGGELLQELFGRSVQIYRNVDDLRRLTSDPDGVFGDNQERVARAARVAAEHSFRARAARLVEVAQSVQRR